MHVYTCSRLLRLPPAGRSLACEHCPNTGTHPQCREWLQRPPYLASKTLAELLHVSDQSDVCRILKTYSCPPVIDMAFTAEVTRISRLILDDCAFYIQAVRLELPTAEVLLTASATAAATAVPLTTTIIT